MKRFGDWLKGLWRRAAKKGRNGCSAACRVWNVVKRWLEPLWPGIFGAILLGSLASAMLFWGPLSAFMRETGAGNLDDKLTNLEIWRNIGLALAAAFGIVFTWWRSVCLGKQTKVAEQGLITDRFLKATEQLGSDSMSVRIGAIYSLWRIAVDSESQSDKRAVLDMLCAFARTPYEPKGRVVEGEGEDARVKEPGKARDDIQTAMNLLGYRMKELELKGEYQIDLVGAILPRLKMRDAYFMSSIRINFSEADLSEADISGILTFNANFSGAILFKSQLGGVKLPGADCTRVDLRDADLSFSNLSKVSLCSASLVGADLRGANLMDSFLYGANFSRADLSGVYLAGAQLVEARFNNAVFSGAMIRKKAALKYAASLEGANLDGIIYLDEQPPSA